MPRPKPAEPRPADPRRVRALTASVLVVALVGAVAGCTAGRRDGADATRTSAGTPEPSPTSTVGHPGPTRLRFSVYGDPPVVAAYQEIAAAFHDLHPRVRIRVLPARDHAAAMDTVIGGGRAPDVFLAEQQDLPMLMAGRRVQPVDELLGMRRIDFGDGYYREGLQAFSARSRLQCMPDDVSPQVVYFNPDLVRLPRIFPGGLDPRAPDSDWDLDAFTEAVRRSTTAKAAGLWVRPDVIGLAPFIWSAGDDVVDDIERPTSLDLEGASGTLSALLTLLRNPRLSLAARGVEQPGAIARFRAGRLAMIVGDRSLTPVLRGSHGAPFDVLPLPSLGDRRSYASVTGLCLSSRTRSVGAAADFIAYAIGNKGASTLAQTGYVVPSNVHVTHTGAFTPPGSAPVHSLVFDVAANNAVVPPMDSEWPEVVAVTAPLIGGMLVDPVIDLETLLTRIDQVSASVFAEGRTESPSP